MWLLSSSVLILVLFAITDAHQNDTCGPKICRETEDSKPVCGSDKISYPARCHLEKAQCQNKILVQAHEGLCTEQRSCSEISSSIQNSVRVQCRPDGSYASAQCHPSIGYCWCVTAQGVPIPQTSVKWSPNVKPRCRRKKKTTKRRSSLRSKKPKRGCKRADRALFNNNIIKVFHTEYLRENGAAIPSTQDVDKVVLEWEFKRLDVNRNAVLDQSEYRDLRKIVKMAVKPKRCSKNFGKACDVNRDQLISLQEWSDCLSRDGMDDVGGKDTANADEEDDEEEGLNIFANPRSPPHGVLYGDGHPTGSGQSYDDESAERKDEDATNCTSDRQTALSEQHSAKLYVPDCTPDGRYQKIQCYKSAGYCWCVNEDTGKNIPGTSVKNQTPMCDQIPAPSRPMKGCPDDKKNVFLKDLMDYLNQRMLKETNGTNIVGNSATWKASREEQISTWSFVVFDKNKNKVLDRNEWKIFKDVMASVKNLKRCGKKLPRYCDINKDRQISMTEWLDCLNTQRYIFNNIATTASPGLTRTGKNPLTMLLDD
ncbi:hypothetical protein FQA39_LY01705 [Lamprigera yunnana]|nr:hypothetical protein FQA39_LY01705 [Lamprigera yunnana]